MAANKRQLPKSWTRSPKHCCPCLCPLPGRKKHQPENYTRYLDKDWIRNLLLLIKIFKAHICVTCLSFLCSASNRTVLFCNCRNAERETKMFSFFSIVFNHLQLSFDLSNWSYNLVCNSACLFGTGQLYLIYWAKNQTSTPAEKLHLDKALNICLREGKDTRMLQPLPLPNWTVTFNRY